jgi:hypothetical protein
MIPPEIIDECQSQAEAITAVGKPVSRAAAVVIVLVWLGVVVWVVILVSGIST